MTNRRLTRLAMAVAGVMVAHQVAAKAVRDAMFLSVWPPTALPAMVIATAAIVVVAVPVYARLLARFSPRSVVPVGFLLSAAAHVVEWRLSGRGNWVAVLIYLHVAGLGALLLSGFWSLTSELFDPKTARRSFGRIAAAGTLGGLAGGLAVAQVAGFLATLSPLLLLAMLHAACSAGLVLIGRAAPRVSRIADDNPDATGVFTFDTLGRAPHLKTLALIVLLSTAGAAVADYLWKSEAARLFPAHDYDAQRLRFFAVFYSVVQVITVLCQTGIGASVRRFGLGRTIAVLPGGLGVMSALALLYQTFPPMFSILRGTESVLRGSFFRSGYELIFVPMDPAEKRRTKTFLDVTCDRAGDALGATVVQAVLLTSVDSQKGELLAVIIALAAGGLYLARRLDVLYLGVVARSLVKQGEPTPIVFGSEAGWTVLDLPVQPDADRPPPRRTGTPALVLPRGDDPRLRSLADLRSGDRHRVEAALARLSPPDALQVAQVIQLLAWDDVVPLARKVLEAHAAAHIGQMNDTLLDEQTDFAIRRRLPRILGTTASERALFGLMRGLEDARFEVRYQCARAIDRIMARGDGLAVDERRLLAAVERELSVTPQVWHGHQLIDRVERDDVRDESGARAQRNLEHVFTLLSAVLPREALQVAYRGIQSNDAELRSLAVEYLDGMLPAGIRLKLWALVDPELAPERARVTPERALEALRESTRRAGDAGS